MAIVAPAARDSRSESCSKDRAWSPGWARARRQAQTRRERYPASSPLVSSWQERASFWRTRRAGRLQLCVDWVRLQTRRAHGLAGDRRCGALGAHRHGHLLVAVERESHGQLACGGNRQFARRPAGLPLRGRGVRAGRFRFDPKLLGRRRRTEEVEARHRHRARAENKATCRYGNDSAHDFSHQCERHTPAPTRTINHRDARQKAQSQAASGTGARSQQAR